MLQELFPPSATVSSSGSHIGHVVLLHGLASTPKEFALMQHPLRRLGVTLHAPQVPGYGNGSLAQAPRWEHWAETAAAIAVRSVPAGEPFVLGGLCAGALLALAVAARRELPQLAGLALLSPSFSFDGWGLPWWYRLRGIAYALGIEDRFAMTERPPFGLKNERLRHWVRQQLADPGSGASLVGPARVSLRQVRESERMSARGPAWLRAIEVPALVVHAREDEISSFRSVQAVIERAANPSIDLAPVDNSYHMITADNDRQRVAELLAAHADRCLRRRADHELQMHAAA